MRNKKIKRIELKVKSFLGVKKLPNYAIKIDKSLEERVAFNKKIDKKYIITISPNNPSGLKHELIHLALKQFTYSDLKINLPVPQKYGKDDKKTRFMEYLTVCLEIKMGNKKRIKKNLNNYEKYGFSRIKEFHNLFSKTFIKQKLNQNTINKMICIPN